MPVPKLAPHDLRRTFAKLAHKGKAALEQIQLSLGHASVTTTERYLGVRQDLTTHPVTIWDWRLRCRDDAVRDRHEKSGGPPPRQRHTGASAATEEPRRLLAPNSKSTGNRHCDGYAPVPIREDGVPSRYPRDQSPISQGPCIITLALAATKTIPAIFVSANGHYRKLVIWTLPLSGGNVIGSLSLDDQADGCILKPF